MNNFLFIDTSSTHLTVVANKGEEVAIRKIENCAMKHSVLLMDEIDKAFKEVDLTPQECHFFGCVIGPGSFTGIRIGISTIKGFAVGANKKMLPLTSFDLIAYNVEDKNFHVVIDGGREGYYVCGYGENKDIIFAPCYIQKEQVEKLNTPLYGFESLPFKNYTKLNACDCLYSAVKQNKDKITDNLQALYIRKSQAEENKK